MSVQRQTKYGPTYHNPALRSEREKWHKDHGNPRMTHHAANRWDERTPDDSVSPEYAYENGVDVSELREHFEDADGTVAHEIVYWYNDGYGVLFVIQSNVIVTIYKEEYLDSMKARLMLLGVRRLVDNE